jgi:hypothetical protein
MGEPMIPRICLTRKPTFGNWPSCVSRQANGFAHANERIESFLNKYNSPMTNDQENSSVEAPTIDMFFSSFGPIATFAGVLATWFNRSKHTIKKGTTTLTSYSNANRIAFSCPTKVYHYAQCLETGIQHDSHHVMSLLHIKRPHKLQRSFDYLYYL